MTEQPEGRDDSNPASDQDSEPLVPRTFGLPGAIMLSFMVAGGVLAGGFLVAYGGLTERVSGHGLLYTAGGLYLAGSFIGFVLGGALGMFGRPIETAARKAFRDQLLALIYALPALFIAFILTGWIAMTVVAVSLGEIFPLVGVSIAYLIGFIIVAVAIRFGWFGVRRAWKRFSEDVSKLPRLRVTWVDEDERKEKKKQAEQGPG